MPARDPSTEALHGALSPIQRLALAYAPRRARLPWLALLALDARLAGVVRHSREPMLAQIRLAWWREHLGNHGADWPEGEPLLGALRSWHGGHVSLVALADGWELMTAPPPLAVPVLQSFAEARGGAFGALAAVLGHPQDRDAATMLGTGWALADLAMRVSHPDERATAGMLAREHPPTSARLGRSMRPLVVLHAMARRDLRIGADAGRSPSGLLFAMRLGLFGR